MSLLDPHVVSQEYFIEDVRTEFASNTFTNYHKVQIKKHLKYQSIINY